MEPNKLSRNFSVKRLIREDLGELLELCKGNTLYYSHCPPAVSLESLEHDLTALPPGKRPEDKYYLGFYDGGGLAAVLDLILDCPRKGTAFIGFFMVDAARQGRGTGSALVREVESALKEEGFAQVRLGYVETNPQSRAFWEKNGYAPTGIKSDTGAYVVVIMEREL